MATALEIWLRVRSRQYQSLVLGNIGVICLQLGEPRLALRDLEQALAVRRNLGDRPAEAQAPSEPRVRTPDARYA